MTDHLTATIARHGYVLPGGVCACGQDLNAPHGGYQKWWRAHLAVEINKAMPEHDQQVAAGAWSEGFKAGRSADHNPMWWPPNPYRIEREAGESGE